MSTVADEAPYREPERKRFIVPCPACRGTGRVARDGSQVRLACRLCWERGVVAHIVAKLYIDDHEQASHQELEQS